MSKPDEVEVVSTSVSYHVLPIDLSVARDKKKFDIAGDRIIVVDINGSVTVRIERQGADEIDLTQIGKIIVSKKYFNQFFLTNTAQPGKTAKLIVGKGAQFEAEPLLSNLVAAERPLKTATTSADISVVPLSFTTAIGSRYMLESISIHFSAAVAPTITLTLKSKYGANYNNLLRSRAIAPAASDYFEAFGEGYEFELGDELILGITVVAATAYVVIRYKLGGK